MGSNPTPSASGKTRAFIIQTCEGDIHGSFRENVIIRQNIAQIPKDYHFTLENTERYNYATNRASVDYLLFALSPLAGHRPSPEA